MCRGWERAELPRYGRIDGVRKQMVARHQGPRRHRLVGVAAAINSAVCHATGGAWQPCG